MFLFLSSRVLVHGRLDYVSYDDDEGNRRSYASVVLGKLFNFFSSTPAKTIPFVILLCLTADDFTRRGRASGWERIDTTY